MSALCLETQVVSLRRCAAECTKRTDVSRFGHDHRRTQAVMGRRHKGRPYPNVMNGQSNVMRCVWSPTTSQMVQVLCMLTLRYNSRHDFLDQAVWIRVRRKGMRYALEVDGPIGAERRLLCRVGRCLDHGSTSVTNRLPAVHCRSQRRVCKMILNR